MVPLLIGRDARRIEDTWHYLYKGAYWRRGPVTMTAIAAVDTALWDIKGKALGVPVYQLLGGRARDGVMVYGHANGDDDRRDRRGGRGATSSAATRRSALQCGRPRAARRPTASAHGKLGETYEPAAKGLPPETRSGAPSSTWTSCRGCSRGCARSSAPTLHLLHDVHHRLTPIEAARLGKALEPHHLFWMEDPVPAELQEGFRLIRQHTTTPLAVGEVFSSIYDCQQLIQEQLIDYIRDHRRARGRHHPPAPHRPPGRAAPRAHRLPRRDRSVARSAWRRRCTSTSRVHNFGIQEYMPHSGGHRPRLPPRLPLRRRRCSTPATRPGLGVDIDEALAATFPYQRAYLPTNRKLDGTVHSW